MHRDGERRWIVLGEDGRYITLGRASDPSEEEIAASEAALHDRGLAGWLAVMEGNPYVGRLPRLLEVRRLANPSRPFAEAAEACISAIRTQRELPT